MMKEEMGLKGKWIAIIIALVMVLGTVVPVPQAASVRAEGGGDPVIIDNGDAGYSESSSAQWNTSGLSGYNGTATRYAAEPGAYAQWSPELAAGEYTVSFYKVAHSSNNPNAQVEVTHAARSDTQYIDLQSGPSGWVVLGTYTFEAGNAGYVKLIQNSSSYNYIRADAVRFEPVTAAPSAYIVDNGDNGYSESASGQWTDSGLTGYNGTSTRVTYAWEPGAYAQWSQPLPTGLYRVSLYKVVHSASDPHALAEIRHDGEVSTREVDLQDGVSGWESLGVYPFASGSESSVKLILDTYGYSLRADAVKFESVSINATVTQPDSFDEVPVDTPFALTFTEPVDASTISSSTIELKETVTGSAVSADYDLAADGVTLTIAPDQPLSYSASYTLDIGSGVMSAGGIPYDGDTGFVFQTEKDPGLAYLFVRPEHFTFHLGTWEFNETAGSLSGKVLRGRTDEDTTLAKPAEMEFDIQTAGDYRIWARTRDYAENQPGSRFFQVGVDGQPLTKLLGQHGTEGFQWETADTVQLTQGTHSLQLIDSSAFYARVDGLFITNDLTMTPPDDYDALVQMDSLGLKLTEDYPSWAMSDEEPIDELTIENDREKAIFYEVPTTNGAVIQQERYLYEDGAWVQVSGRSDPLGDLLFGEGPEWMVFTDMERIDAHTIRLTAENDEALLTADWSLTSERDDPLVDVELEAKQAGAYTLGLFDAPDRALEAIDFLLLPYQYTSKRLTNDFEVVPEQSASTPLAMYNIDLAGAGSVSRGLVVDPSEIQNRWAYADNSRFGLSIRGLQGGVQPGLFAPMFGSEEAALDAQETFSFRYIPLIRQGDWYEAYEHVVRDIYGLEDYRSNVYGSLTDAVFNMQDLILDDDHAGWDDNMKAHYNMEGRNLVSQGAPLAQIQAYLLTEDPEYYEERTLPTLEYLLTRGDMHFTANGPHGGYLDYLGEISPVGEPVSSFGTSLYGGVYAMTRGQSPSFREIGTDNGVRHTDNYTRIPLWHEQLSYYLYTGESQYLDMAKAGADQYIEDELTDPQYAIPPEESFINLAYYPYWQGLLDLYEATNEQRYLDAAQEGARRLMTSVWTSPAIPDEDVTITPATMTDYPVLPDDWNGWWKGNEQDRLGYPEGLSTLQQETVPAWVPSRVGLGLEQKSTFGRSANIIMSNWAPDLLRLSRLTGDSMYETYARNAIIGRFANYPGYYQNDFMVAQMKEDYPYSGPDLTNIYYHHIPALMGLSVDFLVAQAELWSQERLSFPSVRQQGYAYFSNRYYGFESGRFFDENDMWLWLDEGIVTTDNVQADWIAARKDGKVGLALMNESSSPIEVTLTLGDQVTGGDPFNAAAAVYDATGAIGCAAISNGQVTVAIPAHGLIGLTFDAPEVQAPAFASVQKDLLNDASVDAVTADNGPTAAFGKGVVLQIDPRSYDAYIYTEFQPDEVTKAILHWKTGTGGQWQTMEKSTYPFEFTVHAPQVDESLQYYLEIVDSNGQHQSYDTQTLTPLDGGPPESAGAG